MAKTRKEKNKKLYADLEEEMRNNPEKDYEEKLKNLDPSLNANGDEFTLKQTSRKQEEKAKRGSLVVVKKEEKVKKQELVVVNKNKKVDKKKSLENIEEDYKEPVSFTDKLSVEEILRTKIEQQQKLKDTKKKMKKGPNDENYTASMMQERIRQDEGVDVRKEVKIRTKNYRWLALTILFITLIAVIVVGVLLIFRVIRL